MAKSHRKGIQKTPAQKLVSDPGLSTRLDWRLAALIFLLGILVYAGTFSHPFIWDDFHLVVENQQITDPKFLPQIFSTTISTGGYESSYFRPLLLVSFMIDRLNFGIHPAAFRFINILLHALVALGFFGLLYYWMKDTLAAFIGALWFVIHPIHTEAVTYIAGRADPLAGVFVCLFFVSYFRWLKENRVVFLWASFLGFLGALFSKEYTLILPLLLLVFHFSYRRPIRWPVFALYALTVLGYFIFRQTIVMPSGDLNVSVDTTLSDRFPGAFVAITHYLSLLLFPHDLHMGYGRPLFSWADPRALLGIGIAVGFITAAIKLRKREPVICFSILWFFVALLPMLNIFPLSAYMAEHWVYLPSFGFFMGMAWFIKNSIERTASPALVRGFMILFILIYGTMTWRQNTTWADPVAFYQRIIRLNPQYDLAFNNLGGIYFKEGKGKEAREYYSQAIKLNPDNMEAHNNLGALWHQEGNDREAINAYSQALRIKPNTYQAHNSLGVLLEGQGKPNEAMRHYQEALKIEPGYVQAHLNLGAWYEKQRNRKSAQKHFTQAAALSPNFWEVHYALGAFYDRQARLPGLSADGGQEKMKEAVRAYSQAIALNPDQLPLLNALGVSYGRLGQLTKAEAIFRRALKINPQDEESRHNLQYLLNLKASSNKETPVD